MEAKKILYWMAANQVGAETGVRVKLMLIDVKKAHLNPKCDQDVYIWLPGEANPKEGRCGRLERWLCEFRSAAQAWENHYAPKLESVGLRRHRWRVGTHGGTRLRGAR